MTLQSANRIKCMLALRSLHGRLIGAAVFSGGRFRADAVDAVTHCEHLRAERIPIMAKLFDPARIPTIAVTPERAANVTRPILIGGIASTAKMDSVLEDVDGAIILAFPMRPDCADGDLLQRDTGRARVMVDCSLVEGAES